MAVCGVVPDDGPVAPQAATPVLELSGCQHWPTYQFSLYVSPLTTTGLATVGSVAVLPCPDVALVSYHSTMSVR